MRFLRSFRGESVRRAASRDIGIIRPGALYGKSRRSRAVSGRTTGRRRRRENGLREVAGGLRSSRTRGSSRRLPRRPVRPRGPCHRAEPGAPLVCTPPCRETGSASPSLRNGRRGTRIPPGQSGPGSSPRPPGRRSTPRRTRERGRLRQRLPIRRFPPSQGGSPRLSPSSHSGLSSPMTPYSRR